MLKREWGAKSNGKLQHLFIPSKMAILVPDEMTEAFTAGVMIFIEQFQARWPWSIGV